MTILKLCLQNSTEAKIDILRNIVEVIEEEYWLKCDRKKSSAEDIKSEKEKLRPSKGAILKRYKRELTADFRHKNDSYEVLFHDFFKLNQSCRW